MLVLLQRGLVEMGTVMVTTQRAGLTIDHMGGLGKNPERGGNELLQPA